MIRNFLSFLLIGEGAWSGLSLVQDLPLPLAAHDVTGAAIVVLRGVVGLGLFTGGWLLPRQMPLAVPVARVSLAASAILRALELGAGLGATNLPLNLRWPVVAAYAVYVLLASVAVGRTM